MRITLGVILVATFVCSVEASELTGAFRSAFIANSTENCIVSQTSAPENKNISPIIIKTYCTCVSERVADRITLEDAVMAADSSRKMQILTDAGSACAQELFKATR